MLMRLVLFLVYLVCSLAPSWASERHYDIRVSLDPVTRVLDAHMRVTLPTAAEGRFGLGRGFTLQALAIDGQTMDLAAESWPLSTGRPAEIARAEQGPGDSVFADGWRRMPFSPFSHPICQPIRPPPPQIRVSTRPSRVLSQCPSTPVGATVSPVAPQPSFRPYLTRSAVLPMPNQVTPPRFSLSPAPANTSCPFRGTSSSRGLGAPEPAGDCSCGDGVCRD